jgi:hypothetical protein
MDAERAPGGAGYEQAGVVRSRLASFESSLRTRGSCPVMASALAASSERRRTASSQWQ